MLKNVLQNIRCARDASKLFVELGYTADDAVYDREATIVARWKGFKVIAVDATNPRDQVRALARSLAGCSARALAVAVGAPTEIALSAPRLGVPGVSRILAVSLHDPSPAVLDHLAQFRPRASSTGLAHALRVEELLATEIAGERFYAAFRIVLGRMADSLGNDGTETDRRMAALLPLTRVLFLYFVQAKGWLDENPAYLRTLLDESLAANQHFHRGSLNPLCFETLNCPPPSRRAVAHLGRIPYLNGGLFQPHPVERRLSVVFSNELWRDAFDHLFERFRFCVREADEVDAIAPDMLGRVFERVMGSETRHDTGTFYTPEAVVRQIVTASIETALLDGKQFTIDQVDRIVQCKQIDGAFRPAARRKLHQLKVLDPAVGSGAFLLGALDSLCRMHMALLTDQGPHRRLNLRRRILRENLFGVDLNPVAVRLAELRLWLAVVADDPTTDIAAIDPLPNLDGVIRQGDSLLDPIASAAAMGCGAVSLPQDKGRVVARARDALFGASGVRQREAVSQLRAAEQVMAEALLNRAKERADAALKDLAAAARGRDLFGRRSGLSGTQRRAYKLLRGHRSALQRALAAVRDGTVPFFSYEVHAPETMQAGGFSVVIGNPPWVRAERLPAGLRNVLRGRFSWWRSSGTSGFAHLPDLSIAFLQRALELTAPGGAVGLLLPSKIATAGYGEAARAHLVRETTLRYLHRVPQRQANQFGATTYPFAVIAKNRSPRASHSIRLGFSASASVKQCALQRPGPWILVPDKMRSALEDFRSSGTPLGRVASPALGLKTGADTILVGEVIERRARLSRVRFRSGVNEIETSVLRPVLRGRDIKPFRARPARVVLWGYDGHGHPKKSLPPQASAYFAAHRSRLQKRADFVHGPPWTLFRLTTALSHHRVAWPDIARRPIAVALDGASPNPALPLNSCYVSSAPSSTAALAICAVMNSSFTCALVAATADEARGGYRRFNARVASEVPVPSNEDASQALAHLVIRYQQFEDFDQADLDAAVAEALGLGSTTRDNLQRLAQDYS